VLFQRSRIHCSLREASSKDSIIIECAMIAGVLPSAKAIGRASSRLAKSPVGHAIREGVALGSDGLAKKLILTFMSRPYGAPERKHVKTTKIQDTTGAAHHGQRGKAPLAESGQLNAVVGRPIRTGCSSA
jgi:hypothetical protein